MDNYNYPEGSDTDDAPWNRKESEDSPECPLDGSIMEEHDSGYFKKKPWTSYKCPLCGYIAGEPDEYIED
jgi:hypothetical protein